MKYKELLSQKNISAVYILKGDSFLCNNAKKYIVQTLCVTPINISEFDEENFDVNNIINACNQFSFFEERRIVCVHNKEKDLSANEKNQLQKYIDAQNDSCVLIFIDDINSKVFDVLKNVSIVDCKAEQEYLIDYIKTQFESRGKQIQSLLCKKLSELCLGNLTRINLEIKKICDYLGTQEQVTAQVVDLLVAPEIELQIFELTNALGTKNNHRALKILHTMLELGEAPIKILALISGQFRRMMFAKINKGSSAELAKALGCKEYAIIKAKEQATGFSATTLKNILNLTLEADYNIKSGQMSQENALYYLVFAVLNA